MAAPSLTDGKLGLLGLPYVLTTQLGTFWGKLLLIDVAFAVSVCTLAIQTAAARMIFSMARDHVLPGSSQLARVSPRYGTPLLATVIPGIGAALFLVVNIGNASLFLALSSVCIMLLYVAYLMVTVPLLNARLRGSFPMPGLDENGKPLFSLGRAGMAINAIAVVYQLVMCINLGLPRAEVYDPAGAGWAVHYLPIVVLVLTYGIGYFAYRSQRAHYRRACGFGLVEGEPA